MVAYMDFLRFNSYKEECLPIKLSEICFREQYFTSNLVDVPWNSTKPNPIYSIYMYKEGLALYNLQ